MRPPRYERRGVTEVWDGVLGVLVVEFSVGGRMVDLYVEAMNRVRRETIEECAIAVRGPGWYRDEGGEKAAEIILDLLE